MSSSVAASGASSGHAGASSPGSAAASALGLGLFGRPPPFILECGVFHELLPTTILDGEAHDEQQVCNDG